jgi:hypothetical protein
MPTTENAGLCLGVAPPLLREGREGGGDMREDDAVEIEAPEIH